MLAARVSVLVVERAGAQARVRAVWTDDEARSSAAHPAVNHYREQAELVESVRSGLVAHDAGDDLAAEAELGRAARLAAASGHDSTMRLLEAIIDVDDAETGTVRLKRDIQKADEMALATRSTKTVRVQRDQDALGR